MHFSKLVSQLTVLTAVAAWAVVVSSDGLLPATDHTTGTAPLEWAESARLAERSLLLDVASAGERLIAVGERGHVLLSEDGGTTWTQVPAPTRSLLTAVVMVDEIHGWIVGHDAVILYSADGGRNWTRQFFAPGWEAPLFDVWFEDTDHGLAVGAYGLVLETHDGGRSWIRRSIDENEPHFYAMTNAPDETLYLVGEFGAAFLSRDRGQTWVALNSPYKGSFFGALALSDGALVAFGLRGNLYRSENSGLYWRQVETGTTASLMSGLELTDGTIVIVGLSRSLLVSRDGGNTFTPTRHTTRQGLAAVTELGHGRLLAVGEAGLTRINTLSGSHAKTKSVP